MKNLISDLSKENWIESAITLRDNLKGEIQGNGFWKKLRDELNEKELKNEIKELTNNFKDTCNLDDVDASINNLALKIWKINESFTSKLAWDFGVYLQKAPLKLLNNKPNLSLVCNALNSSETPEVVKYRLLGICQHLIFSSISQGNKSNAGSAGEALVEAIFTTAGAVKDIDYRTQYKSNAGSDTDFVIPAIENYTDANIEVLIAVQFSSNDRVRLASSELKTGGMKYIFSGNGLEASKKELKDIGDQIIEGLLKDNVKIICYGPELERERIKLKSKLNSSPSNILIRNRLKYFTDYAITYTEFIKRIKRWCHK